MPTYSVIALGHPPRVHNRLLRPLLATDKPPAPDQLRQALVTIDRHVNG